MMRVSRRVAAGHYDERVEIGDAGRTEELDELGRLAQSFNLMGATLQRIEAKRRDLIGDVAHELRTPLASIKGYMEGLIDGVIPAELATFRQVHHEADRLQRLARDLQELSRVEARAFSLDLRPTSMASVVAATGWC